MKTRLIALALLAFLIVPAAGAHEGHDKAFGKNNSVVSTTQKIRISREGQESMGIKSRPVELGSVGEFLQATGRVQAAENCSFDITPTVAGVVKAVNVKQGDRVSAGQVLATVYSAEVATVLSRLLQERAKIQADIAKARLQYQRDISIQSRDASHCQINLKREEQLLKEGLSARKSFSDAQYAYDQAAARLEALRKQSVQDVALLEKQFAMTSQAVTSQLKVMGLPSRSIEEALAGNRVISEVPVCSPVAGTVTLRNVSQGETLSPGKKIFSVVNLSPIWVIVDIFQEQIPAIELGQTVRLTTASGKTVSGKISSIGTTVDPAEHAIHVRVVTENSSGELKPEMFVTAQVSVGRSKKKQIIVPSAALVEDNGRTLVYVQYDNQFQPVSVQVGSRTGEEVAILDGLFEGDQIVVEGAKQLRAQGILMAAGAKEAQGAHKRTDDRQAVSAPFSLQTLLLGVALGISLVFLIGAARCLANRRSRKINRDSAGQNLEQHNQSIPKQ